MIRSCAVFLALFAAVAAAPAQTALFTVSQNGKQVGTASARFTPADKSIASESIVRVTMDGLDYALSKTETLSGDHQLREVLLSATVNGSAVTVQARPAESALVLKMSANGKPLATRLAAHANAVFLADFDPGALQTLLTLATRTNGRELWAILPKGNGSVEAVTLETLADEQGTLNGKSVTVHHLAAKIATPRTQIFTSEENQLLQAELPQQGFALVRQGFVLTPPTKAPAPTE